MARIHIQNKKKLIWYGSTLVSFLLFLILLALSGHLAGMQDAQQMASRWSENNDVAQVSCFFSPNAEVTEDTIKSFEYSLDNTLQEASITETSENPSARLWADAYSADGRITLVNGRNTLEADAIGIGGDFFLFHPLELITGSYFSGNDLMRDYCIIDQDAAWQLFGSNDVVGMTVYIGNVPHIVTGVVRRPDGRMEEAAGLDSTVVYVSYETLDAYGTNNGINHYEIVMPNPVSGFALGKVKEGIGVDDKNVEVIENTSRYSLLNRCKTILAFGTRSMNGKAIIYPYWENIARGYEDIIALMTVFMLILLLYPVVTIVWMLVFWWRHKGWTLKDAWKFWKDKAERAVERRREKKHSHRETDVLEELEQELEEDPYKDSKFSWLTDELNVQELDGAEDEKEAGQEAPTGEEEQAKEPSEDMTDDRTEEQNDSEAENPEEENRETAQKKE